MLLDVRQYHNSASLEEIIISCHNGFYWLQNHLLPWHLVSISAKNPGYGCSSQ